MRYFIYNNSKTLKTLLIGVMILANIFVFSGVRAEVDLAGPLTDAGTGLGQTADESTLPTQIGAVIKFILGILGMMLVIIIVYAGILWMTAGGEEAQVKKAKDWIFNAVIGLVVTISAYAIAYYVVAKLTAAQPEP